VRRDMDVYFCDNDFLMPNIIDRFFSSNIVAFSLDSVRSLKTITFLRLIMPQTWISSFDNFFYSNLLFSVSNII
jgi:hypothetical protein